MGWTFSNTPETREQCLERLAPANGWTSSQGLSVTFTREHWTAAGCWGILEARRGAMVETRAIAIARIARHGSPGYGEGGLWPETCGPCEDGCPVRLLSTELIDPDAGAQGLEWSAKFRARVRAEHKAAGEAKAARASLQIGQRLTLPEGWNPREMVVVFVSKGKALGEAPGGGGRRFKITPKVCAAASISAA